jgi:two-component system, OmpR family, sensor histidine kinase CiaH
MFRSARVKLTLFYLAVVLAFSLGTTTIVRLLAESEYDNSDVAQQHEVDKLFGHQFLGIGNDDLAPPPRAFDTMQNSQDALVHQRLAQDQVWINIGALVLGGLLSYWFAGETLRPIQRAHETQARFAADASHELRTPLTNMKVENEVFLRQKQFTEAEARSLIESNLEEVQRLENLSTSLLDLTRYGQMALPLRALAVGPLVAAAVKRASKTAKAKKVTITQQLSEGHIEGHHDSLVQLIDIVLDNAIKYGPAEGTVTVAGKVENNHYRVSIRDHGPGIDAADLPRIFDRLYRGDKARSNKVSGYGLGLALAQEIAKANHIAIAAQNNTDGGACFDLYFNLAK